MSFPYRTSRASEAPDQRRAEEYLLRCFDGREWMTWRKYWRYRRDFTPFSSANVLAILQHCRIDRPELHAAIRRCREHLPVYQQDHLTYHWPLQAGQSRIGNSRLLGRFEKFQLSPDADNTCLQQVALQSNQWLEEIREELIFYRVDQTRFQLTPVQRNLPDTEGSYLTWFPPRKFCRPGKIETIDLGVDANILWFLGRFDCLDTPGAEETIRFVRTAVSRELAIEKPFLVSQYYPFPVILLYLISRAAVWGKIEALYPLRATILGQLRKLAPRTALEWLCYQSVGLLWDAGDMLANAPALTAERLEQRDPFFVLPFLAPALHKRPELLPLARSPRFWVEFSSPAVKWAMRLWICQQTGCSNEEF